MARVLYIAAGGGGDVIASAILAAAGGQRGGAAVATLAWDRLLVDPIPGPRSAADFSGLITHRPGCVEVTARAAPIPPAGSLLPQLSAELDPRIFLLDPARGVPDLGRQVRAVASIMVASRLAIVDVGGDLVADGTEAGLRSPLADALMLSACLATDLPVTALVCGPGLDGELTEFQALARCRALNGIPHMTLTGDHVARFQPVLHWHPSEATGLLIAAARGRRGVVEIRDAGSHVVLTDASPVVMAIPHESLPDANPYSSHLGTASTIEEADEILRDLRGRPTELDCQRQKALRLSQPPELGHPREELSLDDLDSANQAIRGRGADYVTLRRLTEMFRPKSISPQVLYRLLLEHDQSRVDPPLWDVRQRPSGAQRMSRDSCAASDQI